MKLSNYEIARNRARGDFLKHDQENMIRKFSLRADEDYLYITFFGGDYRIERSTGVVEGSEDGFRTVTLGGYNESMSIYDVLCCSRPDCCLSGEFVLTNSLPGTVRTAGADVGGGMYQKYARYFDAHKEGLSKACLQLGGIAGGKGDVAYRLPMFEFLPMRLEFWESDDEFAPEIKLFWDRNVQAYMHYETLWFAAGHLLGKLARMIENAG